MYKGTHPWSMNKNPLIAHVQILRKENKLENKITTSTKRTNKKLQVAARSNGHAFMVYEQKCKKRKNVLTVSRLLQTLRTMPQNIQT